MAEGRKATMITSCSPNLLQEAPTYQMSEEEFEAAFQNVLNLGQLWKIKNADIQECINDVFCCNCRTNSNIQCNSFSRTRQLVNGISSLLYVIVSWLFTLCKILLSLVLVYSLISCHNPTQKFIMRKSQSLIYPVMRTVRLWTLPVIRRYESLTEWHEEECILKNPFYVEPPLDCWPCEDVRTLVDLTGLVNYTKAYCSNEQPFLVKDVMDTKVSLDMLKDVYMKHRSAVQQGTAKFVSNLKSVSQVSDILKLPHSSDLVSKDMQILWKINRVTAARVIRQVFKRPYFVPVNSEVALQRFLFLDGPEAPQYYFPLTDFANVWLAQGQGYRLIVLEPSDPCRSNCSTVSVLLKPKDVLYYNWQFWRPRSLPARLTEEASITFMGSFY